jgi:peptide-methionine (S)-S-oxide reductase
MALHPNQPYIVYNGAPKVVRLKQAFPALYREP